MALPFPVEPLVSADPSSPRHELAAELGYLFFPGALDPGPLLALRGEILSLCADRGWLAPGSAPAAGIALPGVRLGEQDEHWVSLQAEAMMLPAVDALRRDPFVLGVLETLFGTPPVAGQGDVLRLTSPAVADLATPPHRDADYVRDGGLWTVWIPLGDCPLELGGLAVLVDGAATWASADYEAGDVLMFGADTLHRAGENRSRDRLRLSIDFRYVPS